MDIKVNQAQMVTQVPDTVTTETGDGTFKFTLASAITDAELQAKVDSCLLYTSIRQIKSCEQPEKRQKR